MKQKVVWKWFWAWNYQEEEAWLNRMAQEGWSLVSNLACRYVFERTEPGIWLYRLEMLDQSAGSAKSKEYLDFLKETRVEHISSWWKWVYLRRRAEDGPFDLFSDIDSRVRHLNRVLNLFWTLLILVTVADIMLLIVSIAEKSVASLVLALLYLALGVTIVRGTKTVIQKRDALEKERRIRE